MTDNPGYTQRLHVYLVVGPAPIQNFVPIIRPCRSKNPAPPMPVTKQFNRESNRDGFEGASGSGNPNAQDQRAFRMLAEDGLERLTDRDHGPSAASGAADYDPAHRK